MALIDKPKSTLGQRRETNIPVVAAEDLEEHRKVPSVSARLQRVAQMAAAQAGRNSDQSR